MQIGMIRRVTGALLGLAAATVAFTAFAPSAQAGGYEWPGIGTRGMGRAGAWAVRTDTALALHLNPANLARLTNTQFEVAVHLSALNACFDRTGTPTRDGTGVAESRGRETNDPVYATDFGTPDQYAGVEYPEICSNFSIAFIPQIGLAIPLHERVTLGVGLIAPNNGGSNRSFGGTSGANLGSYAVDGAPTGRLPAPTRYDVIEADVLLAWLAFGVGVEVHPQVRVGATFGWGFSHAAFRTAVGPVEFENSAHDVMANLSVNDWFVPRVSVSVAADPVPGLEVMAAFTWIDDLNAEGNLNLQPLFWASNPTMQPIPPRVMGWESVDFDVKLDNPQASNFRFGARYAMERDCPEGEEPDDFDPMRDEVFDIELDIGIMLGNNVERFEVEANQNSDTRIYSGVAPGLIPPPIDLEHNWKTQVMVAVGGDINVLPERLALRLGIAYESDGVNKGYERLDFMPWQRIAASLGATVRISSFELSLAYMHLRWFNRTVTEAQSQIRVPVAVGEGTHINAGSYTASANLLSFSAAYRFE